MYNKCISASTTTLFLLFSLVAFGQISKSSVPASASASASQSMATNVAPSAPIPGWKKFEADRVELWLPESYEGGNLEEDLDVVIASMRQLGPDFERFAQTIEQNPDSLALWAFDFDTGISGYPANVTVGSEQVLSVITIDTYLDLSINQLPPQFQVVGREIVSLDRYQAGKLITEFAINGIEGKQVTYVIREDNTIWAVIYTAVLDDFEQRLPDFEQSINTFYVLP